MIISDDHAALVALLRRTGLDGHRRSDQEAVSALAEHLGAGTSLLPEDPAPLLREARGAIARWRSAGLRLLTISDADYPRTLRAVHDRPALLFAAGDAGLLREPTGVAVIGSRRASADGLARAERFAADLVGAGHCVVSGLAAGIDTAAHRAAIRGGGRTVAVIGSGHEHASPPANAGLQAQLAREHLVVSPFWPETPPSPEGFRRRNGVMSGLSLATVILEATERSGTRVQARLALGHGRPVFLHRSLRAQPWAAELARRPGVHLIDTAAELLTTLQGAEDPLG